jgi:flagellar protein FlaG
MLIQNVSGKNAAPSWGNVESPPPASPSAPKVAASVAAANSAAMQADKATGSASSTEPSSAQLKDAVDKINSSMKEINSNLQFSIDDDTKRVVVKVVESKTGEVIKQFPSEEALAIAKAIDRFQKGLLVKQSA